MIRTLAPLDDKLKEILRGYNRNNITSYAMLIERLGEDHGHKIGYLIILSIVKLNISTLCRRTLLAAYLKKTGIGSSRKNLIPDQVATQLILDELENDPRQTRGPRNIKERLALKGKHIPR